MTDVYFFEVDAFPDDTPREILRGFDVRVTEVAGPGFDGQLTFEVSGSRRAVREAAAELDVDVSEIGMREWTEPEL